MIVEIAEDPELSYTHMFGNSTRYAISEVIGTLKGKTAIRIVIRFL